MRLWHYKLIPYLPNSQLIAQWRELNSIYKKEDKHILINYIYEYGTTDLFIYSLLVIKECHFRNIKIKNINNFISYFSEYISLVNKENKRELIVIENIFKDSKYIDLLLKFYADIYNIINPFINHQNDRYLIQCFYNLQEKFDRGQKDFSEKEYTQLFNFITITVLKDIKAEFNTKEVKV